jgi:hypothetical protein
MNLKKRYGLLFVLLLVPLVLAGVVQSVGPPEIHVSAGSGSVNVYGSGWVAYADVTIYYDVEDADHMVGVVTTKYGGNFQVMIPTNYIPNVGVHTIIAVQGVDKATATYNLDISAPPDDRLLNPILNIKEVLSNPIEVINPPGESLNVTVTNVLGLQPVQKFEIFIIGDGNLSESGVIFDVPEGKLLVIEYISASAGGLDSTDTLSLGVGTTVFRGGNLVTAEHYLGLFEPQGREVQFLSKLVKLYCTTQNPVIAYVDRVTTLNDVTVRIKISGYLMDAS